MIILEYYDLRSWSKHAQMIAVNAMFFKLMHLFLLIQTLYCELSQSYVKQKYVGQSPRASTVARNK